MKSIVFLAMALIFFHFSQGEANNLLAGKITHTSITKTPPDSLVTITGIVISAKDSLPLSAKIKYKKLPYGDDIGIYTSRSNGRYEMPVVDFNSYIFEAEAAGYYPLKQQVDIRDFNKDKLIHKNFVLQPLRVGQVLEFENILFEQSAANLLPDSYPVLDKLVDLLSSQQNLIIQLEGHTDHRGSQKANKKLSDLRVKIIRDYLINKGIHRKRVKIKAYGGSHPLSTEDTAEAQRLNRRVEIRILAE